MEGIPEAAGEVLARLEGAGYEAWCVGGAVRDLLLGREPGDWDVTTSAPPEAVLALFAPRSLPTGLRHGTVTVKTGGGTGVEVTTYRRDGVYLDSRHPDHVEFTACLEEDLARRDFTVNAIAMDRRGRIADPFGGREDLSRRVLRAVGRAEDRFREDALRILRCLRFASKLGFAIAPDTAAALRAQGPLLRRIAPERIQAELTGLLCGAGAAEVLLSYPEVLGVFLPEILPCVGFEQRNKHHCFDVWGHTARAVGTVKPLPLLRWTMLLHDLGKPECFTLGDNGQGHFYGHWRFSVEKGTAIMDRLRFDNQSKKTILTLVDKHDIDLPLEERMVRRRLRQLGEETVRLLLEVKRADNQAQAPAYWNRQKLIDQWEEMMDMVLSEESCFSLRQLAVKGGDLTVLGISGPRVGEVLEALLDQVVDGDLPNDRGILLDYAREVLL